MTTESGPIDRSLPETKTLMEGLIGKGYDTFIKWTCPGCGERCVSDAPNSISLGGYVHSEKADGTHCGAEYRELMFGIMAIASLNAEKCEKCGNGTMTFYPDGDLRCSVCGTNNA